MTKLEWPAFWNRREYGVSGGLQGSQAYNNNNNKAF